MPTGSVYKIWSPSSEDIYIGSTIRALSSRMSGHRHEYKRWVDGKSDFVSSYPIIALGDARIELIEIVEFKTKEELRAREGHHIRLNPCVNISVAGRSNTQWRIDNAEQLKNKKAQYVKDNIDSIKMKRKQYYHDNFDDIKIKKEKYHLENREKNLISMRQYSIDNHDKIETRRLKFYEDNRARILEKARASHADHGASAAAVKCTCECGSIHRYGDTAPHRKTAKHQAYLKTQEET
jgi:hypothetical protein